MTFFYNYKLSTTSLRKVSVNKEKFNSTIIRRYSMLYCLKLQRMRSNYFNKQLKKYLFETHREREREIFYLLIYFPNGCNGCVQARPTPGPPGASSWSPVWAQELLLLSQARQQVAGLEVKQRGLEMTFICWCCRQWLSPLCYTTDSSNTLNQNERY